MTDWLRYLAAKWFALVLFAVALGVAVVEIPLALLAWPVRGFFSLEIAGGIGGAGAVLWLWTKAPK